MLDLLRHSQPVNDHIGDVKARMKAQTSEHSQTLQYVRYNTLTIAPSCIILKLCPRILRRDSLIAGANEQRDNCSNRCTHCTLCEPKQECGLFLATY